MNPKSMWTRCPSRSNKMFPLCRSLICSKYVIKEQPDHRSNQQRVLLGKVGTHTSKRLGEIPLGPSKFRGGWVPIGLETCRSGPRTRTGAESLTDIKWSNKLTCPNCPWASRFAYSAFLIEWMETASAIVSTKPDEPPVMRIRKL